MDHNIEQKVKACPGCISVGKMPASAPLHPWEWPARPWSRLHMDFAGPFLGRMFLIVVDAHSKWPEVVPMSSTTSANTISALRNIFARFGLPNQLVSDNGPQFCSEEFATFMNMNKIRHSRVAPYHPSSNGLAERFVQTFKLAMKCAKTTDSQFNLDKHLNRFLMAYRNAPHSTTNVSPASLLLGHPLRTRLDLTNPNCEDNVLKSQSDQIERRRQSARNCDFQEGDKVLVRDYRQTSSSLWQSATVSSKSGPVSYHVTVPDSTSGVQWRRHVDQMKPSTSQAVTNSQAATQDPEPNLDDSTAPVQERPHTAAQVEPATAVTRPPSDPPDQARRNSIRTKKKTERLIEIF